MIPTPAKRRHQLSVGDEEAAAEAAAAEARALLFNGLALAGGGNCPAPHTQLGHRQLHGRPQQQVSDENDDEMGDGGDGVDQEGDLDDEDQDFEAEEFDYLRLDTIVEEDESLATGASDVGGGACDEHDFANHQHQSADAAAAAGCCGDHQSDCDKMTAARRRLLQRKKQQESTTSYCDGDGDGDGDEKRPQAESDADQTSTTPSRRKLLFGASNGGGGGDDDDADDDDSNEQRRRQQQQQLERTKEADKTNTENNNQKCDTTIPTSAKTKESSESALIGQQQQQQQTTTAAAKMQQQRRQQQQQQQQSALPSTNRLISEHQVRQQQALFRALAERQKLMDELGASGQRMDLMMSTSCLGTSLRAAAAAAKGRARGSGTTGRRKRSAAATEGANKSGAGQATSAADGGGGVPLSAVDLSSMSDRMLDELLGHIASASSSSLSSNGESLDSSDLSSGTASDSSTCSDGDDHHDQNGADSRDHRHRRRHHRRATMQLLGSGGSRLAAVHDAPNVIGVHEDERTRAGGCGLGASGGSGRRLNCRDTHRRSCDNGGHGDEDDDDDDNNDHELVVHVGPAGELADSLSPTSAPDTQRRPPFSAATTGGRDKRPRQSSKLEQYFTSGLVNPHEFSTEAHDETEALQLAGSGQQRLGAAHLAPPAGASVEEVLTKMLEALNEIGTDDQEQLSDLLERGFLHLEQLLNPTAPGGSGTTMAQQATASSNSHLQLRNNTTTHATNLKGRSFAGTAATTITTNSAHHPPANMAQKLISTSGQQQQPQSQQQHQGGSMSKDSDYGSDTQSADCFLQFADSQQHSPLDGAHHPNHHSHHHHHQHHLLHHPASNGCGPPASESPSPSSLTTTSSSTAHSSSSSSSANYCSSPTTTTSAAKSATGVVGGGGGGGGVLSPLARELSLRLAESLHRLAQQQQQQVAVRRQDHRGSATPNDDNNWMQQQQQQRRRQQQALSQPETARRPIGDAAGSAASPAPDELLLLPRSSPVATTTPPAVAAKKSPMKSIVMINATRSPSAASIVSSSSSSLEPLAAQRNMTPINGGNEQQQDARGYDCAPTSRQPAPTAARQQFKTRVNIGSPSSGAAGANNVVIAPTTTSPPPPPTEDKQLSVQSSGPQQAEDLSNSSSSKRIERSQSQEQDQEHEEAASQVIKVTSGQPAPVAAPTTPKFERRRSARSSLRRRPSLTKAAANKEPGAPRPGSPVPRLLSGGGGGGSTVAVSVSSGEQASKSASGSTAATTAARTTMGGEQRQEPQQQHNSKHQKQLQRALILAQKYNYSPAKMAASKLGSQLQLKDLTTTSGRTQPAAAAADTGIAINGSQTLNNNNSGQPNGRQESNGTLQQQQQQRATTQAATSRRQEPIRVTGQVQLDISYFAKSGSLTVHLIQCTQLAPVSKRRTTSNPYAKLYLLPDRSKGGKRKSAIHRSQLDPKFDEKFTFGPLQLAEFEQKIFWLSIWHKDRLGRNEFLGELLLPLGQVRQQLLSSDLCHSTSAKWYQLRERFDATQQLAMAAEGTLSASLGGHQAAERPSSTGSRKQKQAALAVAEQPLLTDRLGELHRKAARLSAVAAAAASPLAPPVNSQQQQQHQAAATPKPSGAELKHQQMMSVSLGPVPGQAAGANQAPITGQLFVALKFVPDNPNAKLTSRTLANMEGELQVMVKEAHEIAGFESPKASSANSTNAAGPPPSGSLPNPFCKCYLLASNGQRVAKQKTPHLKRTVNPRWDHKIVFGSVRLSALASQAVEILLFNRDSFLVSNNEYLGGVRLCNGGPTSSSSTKGTNAAAAVDPSAEPSSVSSSTLSRTSSSSSSFSSSRRKQAGAPPEAEVAAANEDAGGSEALCSEREARLWGQMLSRPNIWVYGELRLRQLRPLVAASGSSGKTAAPASG